MKFKNWNWKPKVLLILCMAVAATLVGCGIASSASTRDGLSVEAELSSAGEETEAVEEDEAEEEETAEEEAGEDAEEEAEAGDTSETEEDAEEEVEEVEAAVYTYTDLDTTVWTTVELRMRSGPSTDYDTVGYYTAWAEVTVTGQCNETGWYRVDKDGTTAYISSKYTTDEEPEVKVNSTSYPLTYSDSTATITITKEKYAGSWCYIAHLQFSDYSRFSTTCGNGTYGGYETTSSAAKRVGAIFAVNGDYSAPSLGYAVARGGKVYNDKACTVPAIYNANTGIFCSPETAGVYGSTLSTLVANGQVTDTFCFGPAGLVNGSVVSNSDTSRAQRTFIGTNGSAGDLYIVVSEGRYADGESAGLTFQECMQLLKDKGCTFGIPLDGGGSSTMYFNGTVLNSASSGQRSVVDFAYFK